MNSPSGPDDSGQRGVQVQLGDKTVSDAKESLWIFLGLLLQLTHSIDIGDGVHCTQEQQHIQHSPKDRTRCIKFLTSFIFKWVILVQKSRLRNFLGVVEQKTGFPGVWGDKCKLTSQQEDIYFWKEAVWVDSQNSHTIIHITGQIIIQLVFCFVAVTSHQGWRW